MGSKCLEWSTFLGVESFWGVKVFIHLHKRSTALKKIQQQHFQLKSLIGCQNDRMDQGVQNLSFLTTFDIIFSKSGFTAKNAKNCLFKFIGNENSMFVVFFSICRIWFQSTLNMIWIAQDVSSPSFNPKWEPNTWKRPLGCQGLDQIE